jgi:hypothetical protein
MSYISLGRLTTTVILTVTGLLTAAALAVTGAFQLVSQTAGQVLWTNSGGVVTSTSDFTYTSTTQTLGVENIVINGTCTGCGTGGSGTNYFTDSGTFLTPVTSSRGLVIYGDTTLSNLTVTGTIYGSVSSSQVSIARISTTTTLDSLYDYLNYTGSSGSLTTSTISNAGGGVAQLGTRDIWIKTANTVESEGKFFTFATDTVALTDNQLNYLYIDYNGGIPDLKATTDRTTIHDYDHFTVGRVYREGANLDIVQSGVNLYNEYRRIHNRLVKKYGFDYASGATVSETPTLKLGVTAGVFYVGNTEIDTVASSTAYIKSYYRDGGTGWTEMAASSTFADPLYDDNSGTLATVLPNQYALFWLYECPQGSLYRVFGQSSYTLAVAQAALPPSTLPDYINKNTRLRAKVYYLRGGTSFAQIDNVSAENYPMSTAAPAVATTTWYGPIGFSSATGSNLTLNGGLVVSSTTGIPLGATGLNASAILTIDDANYDSNLVFNNSSILGSLGFTNYISEAGLAGSRAEVYTFAQVTSSAIGWELEPSEAVAAGLAHPNPAIAKYWVGKDPTGYMSIFSSFGPYSYADSNKKDIGGSGLAMRNIYASGTGFIANVSSTNITVGGLSVCLANGTNCPFATIAITNTGTATASAVTPDALAGSYAGTKSVILYVASSTNGIIEINGDASTSTCLTIPQALNGMNLVTASGTHRVAGTGAYTKINVRNQTDYTDMLSTDIHIDGGETKSWTAVTSTVIDTSYDDVVSGDIICADVLGVETTPGKESQVILEFRLP